MSNSGINIPQPFLQALSAALITKLDPATLQKIVPAPSDVPPQKESPAFKSVVNELFVNLIRNNISAQASPRTPRIAAPRSFFLLKLRQGLHKALR